MALESLLASLKSGVTEVTGVQASRNRAFACNPTKFARVAEATDVATEIQPATHETLVGKSEVTVQPAPIEACTHETLVTPRTIKYEVGTDSTAQPFDREAFEERAAICEFDGGLSRDEAEALAWWEDDRRRCRHCLNLQPNGVCKVASPTGIVVANRGYRPVDIPKRCEGYRPCPDDPDRRNGLERWWPSRAVKGGA